MDKFLGRLPSIPELLPELRKEMSRWRASQLKALRQVRAAFFKRNAVQEIREAMSQVAETKHDDLRNMLAAIGDFVADR
jgi:hypothetical protein